jgi:predicted nucleic acid-binding Zn ribbon protein
MEFKTVFKDFNSRTTKYNRLSEIVEQTKDADLKQQLSEAFSEIRWAVSQWDALVAPKPAAPAPTTGEVTF